MKRFLKNLSYFLLPVLVLAYPLDIFLSNNLKKSKAYGQDEYSVYNDMYSGNLRAEVVVYGSSRAWTHLNPILLEKGLHRSVYNLGLDGHTFQLQYLRHLEYLKYNPKPRYILYSLDVFTLERLPDLYNVQQFLPYMLYNENIKNFTLPYGHFSFLDYYLPLLRYSGKKWAVLHAVKNAVVPVDQSAGRVKGYRAKDETWNGDFEKAQEKLQYYKAIPDPELTKLFHQFLQNCARQNIEVIFVYSPEYIEGQKFVQNREEILQLYRNMAAQHRLLFLDYSQDKISQEKKFFYNVTHLNKTGSEAFTNTLLQDLKRLKPAMALP
ncbi:hypothetical protein [Rufibacter roseus]|uniref:DUF1574 domain-containing protein n=1 Tax=Rufibacter roseus TaxID=1567108 RepID=A0ABW2DQI2_9BACT|nr:hypothetical protein [Rufibacter roseus]